MAAFTDEKVNETDVRAFMEKVHIVTTPDIPDMSWLAKAKIEVASGRTYESEIDVGTIIYPIEVKKQKIGAKFEDLCTPVLGSAKTREVAESILSLDKVGNMADFVAGVG